MSAPTVMEALEVDRFRVQQCGSPRSILLIGEAPACDARKRGLEFALVAKALSIPRPWLRSYFTKYEDGWPFRLVFEIRHANLLREWPGYDRSGGSKFPLAAGRRAAVGFMRALAAGTNPYGVILLCGTRIRRVWRSDTGYFEWFQSVDGLARCSVVPHPSGMNRWWNSADHREQASGFLRELARELEV